MPVNSGSLSFPYNEDSWFFGFMSRADATELLTNNNEIGAFLVRESTTAPGNLVLSVKEKDDKVSHYIINRMPPEESDQVCFRIGDQVFWDIPTLLTFYRLNNLDTTPLRAPATPKDPAFNKRNFTRDYLVEAQNASSPVQTKDQQVVTSTLNRKLPGKAIVIRPRIPNAYDKTALTLREGDIIRVTKVDISGCWEGETCGRKGHFPFNHVKFIDDE